MTDDTPVAVFTIPAEHPALPGHFPGRPIVPGVVLLDHVLEALAAHANALPSVKFLHPVRPGDPVEILASAAQPGRLAFTCRVHGRDVVRGTVLLAPPE